ncbi:MAG: hypothetical protein K6F32_04580 [Bacilli bacterium]|nr:hypothetical protein [Bacilli bacterium]
MKDLRKQLSGHKILVFMDLEGTQITHETIEIGAYKAIIKDDLTLKKLFKPFRCYVKPKGSVGKIVTRITGIDSKLIHEKGITFRAAQQQLQKYLGRDYKKCLFVAYGDQDAKMIISSAEHNMDASMEEARFVAKHTFDFCAFMRKYITDANGNTLSLTHALELFGVKFEGQAHDATVDAYNLAMLYKAFVLNKDLVRREYQKTLMHGHGLPEPVAKLIRNLQENGQVAQAEFDNFVDEALK